MTGNEAVESRPTEGENVDAREIERFTSLAEAWWDPNGAFRPIHRFNWARLKALDHWVARHFDRDEAAPDLFRGLRVLDVGCGAGLVCEPLAARGAEVLGIDATPRNVEIARWHARQSGLDIGYRGAEPHELLRSGARFDIVLSLEVVEHVPEPERLLADCAGLVDSGGLLVVATLNRTIRSFLFAILGAEYVLRWLPRGTHRWDRFLRPGEISAFIAPQGLAVCEQRGVTFSPLRNRWTLSDNVSVNYMLLAKTRVE